jgi:hypothetical protein
LLPITASHCSCVTSYVIIKEAKAIVEETKVEIVLPRGQEFREAKGLGCSNGKYYRVFDFGGQSVRVELEFVRWRDAEGREFGMSVPVSPSYCRNCGVAIVDAKIGLCGDCLAMARAHSASDSREPGRSRFQEARLAGYEDGRLGRSERGPFSVIGVPQADEAPYISDAIYAAYRYGYKNGKAELNAMVVAARRRAENSAMRNAPMVRDYCFPDDLKDDGDSKEDALLGWLVCLECSGRGGTCPVCHGSGCLRSYGGMRVTDQDWRL